MGVATYSAGQGLNKNILSFVYTHIPLFGLFLKNMIRDMLMTLYTCRIVNIIKLVHCVKT